MRCFNVLHALLDGQEEAFNKDLSKAPKKVREAKKLIEERQGLYAQWIQALYKVGGRELTTAVAAARVKADEPDMYAAVEESWERVRQQVFGKRKPPKPNLHDLCLQAVEVASTEKVNERLREYQREAELLAKKQASCLK